MNTAMTDYLMTRLERIVNSTDKNKLQHIKEVIVKLLNGVDVEPDDKAVVEMLTVKIREIGKHFIDTVKLIEFNCKGGDRDEAMNMVLDSCDAFIRDLDTIVAEFCKVNTETDDKVQEDANDSADTEYQDRLKRCIALSADLEGQIRSAKRLLSGDDNTGKRNNKIVHRNGDGVCFVINIDDDNPSFNQLLNSWLKQVKAVANHSANHTLGTE